MPKHHAAGTSLGTSTFSKRRARGRNATAPTFESLEVRLLMSGTPQEGAGAFWQPGRARHPVTAALRASDAPAAAPETLATNATASVSSSATPAPLPGDADSNGTVAPADYATVVRNFGISKGATWALGDFDGDGAVTIADYTTVVRNMGRTQTVVTSGGGITPAAAKPPTNITWSGPLIITKGGTYTGNWQSTSAGTAAVRVRTTEPVVILDANIQSRSGLIISETNHTNITVKNTHGWALNPNVSGQLPGRFLDVENFDNLDVENNTLVGTAGIEMGYYMGNGTSSQTVKILRNNALNIDGRYSDGNGGYQTSSGAYDDVQFAQFNHCFNMNGVEIAWNQVVNQAGQSRVEDNISVYISSGTTASPILIHDNYIQGAYPADAANDGSFSGGGIMLSDGSGGSQVGGNVQAYNNIIVSTANYGIGISSGHNNVAYNNTVISSGLLPNGQKIASQNVGVYVWNQGDPNFGNNQEYGNTVGWMGPGGKRNDVWVPNATGKTGDTALTGTITLAVEQSYYNVWAQKVGASGYVIGAA